MCEGHTLGVCAAVHGCCSHLIQVITRHKNVGNIIQPCLTMGFTLKDGELSVLNGLE